MWTNNVETLTIDVIFDEFFIFAEIDSQKGARNWFFGFFNFAWAGDCVGWSKIPTNERLFDFAHYDTHMGFQNGAQAGLNTIFKFCVGVPKA